VAPTFYDRKRRRVRDLSCGDKRVLLDLEVRRVDCVSCGKVKQERLDFLASNPFYTKRFAFYVGRRCRSSTIKDIAQELHLDWHTVKALEKQYMQEQLRRAGTPGPKVIGIDEISIKKRHTYRIVVSDLVRARPIRFGGKDRSEASMDEFFEWLGPRKSRGIRMAVMDMWKPFRTSTTAHAPQASILFDKFHVLRYLGDALDAVRKSEYARLTGKDRRFIKGQKYTLLSSHENLTLEGRRSLKLLLAANRRINTAYLLKESFGQLWDYTREGWARRFFENWRDSLKWQRLKPYEVCQSLLRDLIERGLVVERARLFVIDGGKGIRKAIRDTFAEWALIQRCQIHKLRNVLDHLPVSKRAAMGAALRKAWSADSEADARKQLAAVESRLELQHPGAVAALREGLDETLTLLRLGVTGALHRTLCSTNPIENLQGALKRAARRVKRWRGGSMALRWAVSAVMDAEKRFRRIRGYRQLVAFDASLSLFSSATDPIRQTA
jgi:transposase